MPIATKNLTATPANLAVGDNDIKFSYEGFVDGDTDNPVIATIILAPTTPVVFTGDGKTRKLPGKTFPKGSYQSLSDTVKITVSAAGGGQPCLVTFTFVTKSGAASTQTVYLQY